MFDLLEEVKAIVIKDNRNAETLMIDKTRQAMSEVLNKHFDRSEEKIDFITAYAESEGWYIRFTTSQAPLWDWVADRLTTRMVVDNVFNEHFIDGVGEYKNPKERLKIGV